MSYEAPYEINLAHLRIFLEKIIFISREIGKSKSYGPLKERQRTALTRINLCLLTLKRIAHPRFESQKEICN